MNLVRRHLKQVVAEGLRPAFTSRVMAKVVQSESPSVNILHHPLITLIATLVLCVALTELHARGTPKAQVLDASWANLIAVAHEWRLHL